MNEELKLIIGFVAVIILITVCFVVGATLLMTIEHNLNHDRHHIHIDSREAN